MKGLTIRKKFENPIFSAITQMTKRLLNVNFIHVKRLLHGLSFFFSGQTFFWNGPNEFKESSNRSRVNSVCNQNISWNWCSCLLLSLTPFIVLYLVTKLQKCFIIFVRCLSDWFARSRAWVSQFPNCVNPRQISYCSRQLSPEEENCWIFLLERI